VKAGDRKGTGGGQFAQGNCALTAPMPLRLSFALLATQSRDLR